MGFDKNRSFRIFGVTNQNSSVRLPIGDSSAGTFTAFPNPLRGSLMWDKGYFVLAGVSVAGGATGGSYTITVQTDAILGYTGLPIAQVIGIGPNTRGRVVLQSLHNAPSIPQPTHLFINQTASGGGIWLQGWVEAKQYRGTFGTPASKSAERIIMGNMLRGTSASAQFGDDKGIASSTTFALGTTGSDLGMNRLRQWDNALFWVVAGNSLSGTHDVAITGRLTGFSGAAGGSFTIAVTGTTGNLSSAGQKLALFSNISGMASPPKQIIWTVVSAGGVSDARVVVMAKSGRGQLGKQ